MQLLVLALMLLMSGKNTNLQQIKPILEEFGGGKAADALKQAEELSGMVSAVQALAAMTASEKSAPESQQYSGSAEGNGGCSGGFPLAPVAGIADERITYCLSRYIALGE